MPKVYLHERVSEYRCQAGLAEFDTMAPHEMRHECNRLDEHDGSHVCSCGLVLDTDPRRELHVYVPVSPPASLDEEVVRGLALLSARKQCDDPEVVGFRWLPAEEIDAVLREHGIAVAEVELLGTPRA